MMKRDQPIVFMWREVAIMDEHGEIREVAVMVPAARYRNVAARQFELNEEYALERVESRSMASHNQYFAALQEGFHNLPEKIAARWPTHEHMRKWLLIETHWCYEKEFTLSNDEEVSRLATFIRTESPYARLTKAAGNRLIIKTARSQSLREMGKKDFEASKKDVLDLLESFTGVPRGALLRNAGQSA